jgi:prefoldin alpha subunit
MSANQQNVPISSLPLQTLSRLQQQLSAELEHLSTSYQRLRAAQTRFRDCMASIKATLRTTDSTSQLIPLTTSLYVPAKPSASKSVLVDVGTGFYVEKSPDDGIRFYEEKVKELEGNLQGIEEAVRGKTETLRAVEDGMRRKVVAGEGGSEIQKAVGGG